MLVCTTRAMASDITDLEQEYPYIYWMPEEKTLALSKKPLSLTSISSNNGIVITSFNNGVKYETNTFDYTFFYVPNYVVGDAYRLIYNDVTGWVAEYPDFIKRGLTQSGTYYSVFGRESTFQYYSNVTGDLPIDIPPFDDDIADQINNALNDAINSTTIVTDHAENVRENMQSSTEQFESGMITEMEFEMRIQSSIDIINDLNYNSGATLADQIAINNAQNSILIAQDKLIGTQLNESVDKGLQDVEIQIRDQMYNDNRISNELRDQLNRLFAPGNFYVDSESATEFYGLFRVMYLDPYFNGEISKNEALYELEIFEGAPGLVGIRAALVQGIGNCQTLGDYEFLNQLIGVCDKAIDGINQAGDVNPDIAESADSQESDEIDLLNNMIQEMQGNEPEKIMNNQKIQQDLHEVTRWIDPLWNNSFVSAVVTVFCILVPICVILDLRYRYL